MGLIEYNEGTKGVKLKKGSILIRHYEKFFVKEGEFVDNMHGRLEVLLNGIKDVGHTNTKAQINLKVLDSFPKVW